LANNNKFIMFSGGFRGQKLKTSLRLSINRLKLMEKKKSMFDLF